MIRVIIMASFISNSYVRIGFVKKEWEYKLSSSRIETFYSIRTKFVILQAVKISSFGIYLSLYPNNLKFYKMNLCHAEIQSSVYDNAMLLRKRSFNHP